MLKHHWKRFKIATSERFKPALITCLKEGYSTKTLTADIIAGLIVAAVALPLAIAFSIAAGLSPQAGLVTAVVAGFLISACGGCRVQIGGPTGAFIVIIYGIVMQFGTGGLMLATIMAGAILIILGLCGLGSIIKYIPYPVTVGFTSGIALIIFTGQIETLLGLNCTHALAQLGFEKMPGEFIEKIDVYIHSIKTIHWSTLALSTLTILICVYWKKVTQKVPGSIIAILVTTFGVWLGKTCGWESVEQITTIGSKFPDVAQGVTFSLPSFDFSNVDIRALVSPAISIALLAGIESLLSAVVADGMTGKRHHSNTELIGEGIANIASPLLGGIPATGAIARTATNIKNGGQTPMAGIFHAVFLLIIMLFLGKYAAMIPMATLGGIVAVVAYNMSELHLVKGMFKSTRSDVLVMLTSFLLTVLIDLTVAIQAGVLLAAFLFIRRMSESTEARNVTRALSGEINTTGTNADDLHQLEIPKGVEVFEIYGALFFGAADKFKDTVLSQRRRPKVLILRMRHVLVLDATALHSLEEVYAHTKRKGVSLILSGVAAQPLMLMARSGFLDKIGQENVHGHILDALKHCRNLLDTSHS